MSLEVLVAAESLVAAGVIALAHGTANNIDRAVVFLCRLAAGTDLSTLQFRSLALNLVDHHLAVGTKTPRRRGRALEVVAADRGLALALNLQRLEVVGGQALLGEEGDGRVVGTRPGRGAVGHVGARDAVGGSHHEGARTHGRLRRDGIHGESVGGRDGAHGVVRLHAHAQHGVVLGADAVHSLDGSRWQDFRKSKMLDFTFDRVTKHVLGDGCGGRGEVGVVSSKRSFNVEGELVRRRAARRRGERVAGRRSRGEAGSRRRAGHGLAVHAERVVHLEAEIRVELDSSHCELRGKVVVEEGMDGSLVKE